ncbi:MAG: rhodanese-like domain-containing protein [Betaproteobacteria bacterium]
MALALAANFGSIDLWRERFFAFAGDAGDDVRNTSVTLAFRPRDSTLVNIAAHEHSKEEADLVTLLIWDADKHASNVDAFMASVNWAAVYDRYRRAVYALSEPFAATHDDLSGKLLFDVRRAAVYEQAMTRIPGATWRDPANVAEWAALVPADREVIVYCVYGHEVGRATAMRLRAAGKNARFLEGGIDGWQASGRPLDRKAEAL